MPVEYIYISQPAVAWRNSNPLWIPDPNTSSPVSGCVAITGSQIKRWLSSRSSLQRCIHVNIGSMYENLIDSQVGNINCRKSIVRVSTTLSQNRPARLSILLRSVLLLAGQDFFSFGERIDISCLATRITLSWQTTVWPRTALKKLQNVGEHES